MTKPVSHPQSTANAENEKQGHADVKQKTDASDMARKNKTKKKPAKFFESRKRGEAWLVLELYTSWKFLQQVQAKVAPAVVRHPTGRVTARRPRRRRHCQQLPGSAAHTSAPSVSQSQAAATGLSERTSGRRRGLRFFSRAPPAESDLLES